MTPSEVEMYLEYILDKYYIYILYTVTICLQVEYIAASAVGLLLAP